MKRLLDIFLSIVGLIVSFPLWIVIGLLIWSREGRPIFYIQERVGLNGRIFNSLKFRSMIESAEECTGPSQAKEGDERITKIGMVLRATAMDELPQLINILKGDMSFVGPRALRPVEIDDESAGPKSVWEFEDFEERCKVRPGLTGIAQILAPRDIPRGKKFKYDIWYIKNRNFRLDIKIILVSFLISFIGKWETRTDRLGRLRKWVTKENII